MVTSFAPAAPTAFTTEIGIDAYRLLSAPHGALVAPTVLDAGELPPERVEAARVELLARALLLPDGRTHPLVVLAFALLRSAPNAVVVTSWTPTTTSTTVGVAAGVITATATLTVVRDRVAATTDVAASTEGTLRLSMGRAELAVAHLRDLVDATAPAVPAVAGRHRVGVLAARAVVAALRRGDEALASQVAREVGATQELPLLRGLADTFEAGFRLAAQNSSGLPIALSEWYQAVDGRWFTASLRAPTGGRDAPSAELLAEEGELVIDVRDARGVVADVLALYARWAAEAAA